MGMARGAGVREERAAARRERQTRAAVRRAGPTRAATDTCRGGPRGAGRDEERGEGGGGGHARCTGAQHRAYPSRHACTATRAQAVRRMGGGRCDAAVSRAARARPSRPACRRRAPPSAPPPPPPPPRRPLPPRLSQPSPAPHGAARPRRGRAGSEACSRCPHCVGGGLRA
jgi:hypothetical protein